MIVIITNKRTGAEERADAETANRLKNSKYGENFDFKEIVDPPEIAKIAEDHVHIDFTAKKKGKSSL